jgi:hypothetical protein
MGFIVTETIFMPVILPLTSELRAALLGGWEGSIPL